MQRQYHPEFVIVTDAFFAKLTNYLKVLELYKCQIIIIISDFNTHGDQ